MYWHFGNFETAQRIYVVDDGMSRIDLYVVEAGGQLRAEPSGKLVYSHDDQGRRSLDSIVANPQGTGLGSVMMWCFAVSASTEHQQVSLTHAEPGGVRDWYERLGFVADPEHVQQAALIAATGGQSDADAEAEMRAMILGLPMIADSGAVAPEAETSWRKAWGEVPYHQVMQDDEIAPATQASPSSSSSSSSDGFAPAVTYSNVWVVKSGVRPEDDWSNAVVRGADAGITPPGELVGFIRLSGGTGTANTGEAYDVYLATGVLAVQHATADTGTDFRFHRDGYRL